MDFQISLAFYLAYGVSCFLSCNEFTTSSEPAYDEVDEVEFAVFSDEDISRLGVEDREPRRAMDDAVAVRRVIADGEAAVPFHVGVDLRLRRVAAHLHERHVVKINNFALIDHRCLEEHEHIRLEFEVGIKDDKPAVFPVRPRFTTTTLPGMASDTDVNFRGFF